jgi:hypothetical protein
MGILVIDFFVDGSASLQPALPCLPNVFFKCKALCLPTHARKKPSGGISGYFKAIFERFLHDRQMVSATLACYTLQHQIPYVTRYRTN